MGELGRGSIPIVPSKLTDIPIEQPRNWVSSNYTSQGIVIYNILLTFISYISQITSFQCVYTNYMSLEDWRGKQDILGCNPNFHHYARYDCVVINTGPITFARLQFIFRCEDLLGGKADLALVWVFENSKRKPAARWDGCRILEEKGYQLLSLKYIVRGCRLIPTFEKHEGRYYLNDLVDGDAFVIFSLNKHI